MKKSSNDSIFSAIDFVWGAIFGALFAYYGVDLMAKFGLFDDAKISILDSVLDLSGWAIRDFRLLSFAAVCLGVAAISSIIRHKKIAAYEEQERNDRMSRQYR
jgi:hypothetical protein